MYIKIIERILLFGMKGSRERRWFLEQDIVLVLLLNMMLVEIQCLGLFPVMDLVDLRLHQQEIYITSRGKLIIGLHSVKT